MNKVSDVLAERFSQYPFEIYFCKQQPAGAWIDKWYTPFMLFKT